MSRQGQRDDLLAQAKDTRSKKVSAMLRVRDEEEFLMAAVASIIDEVEELILVDNLSTDDTPRIIVDLAKRYPEKVRSYQYPHEVLRVGQENWTYSQDPARRGSPRLSANFYNWCLDRCTKPYILKWDGDMIALPRFYQAMQTWRESDKVVVSIFGLNLHANRKCYMAARCTDREPLLARLSVPGLPWWATVLTRDSREPRLFPRRYARYGSGPHWTQGLDSPIVDRDFDRKAAYVIPEEGSFLHMKFCKKNPWTNYSSDLAEVIASNIIAGPPLEPEVRELLEQVQSWP